MQKTNSARTFDGPRKPRTHKNPAQSGGRSGAGKTSTGYRGNKEGGRSQGGYQGNRGGAPRAERSWDNDRNSEQRPRGGGYPRNNESGGYQGRQDSDRRYSNAERLGGDRGGYRGGDRDDAARTDRGGYRGGDRTGSYRGGSFRGNDRSAGGYQGANRSDSPRGDRDDRNDRGSYRGGDRTDFSRSDRHAGYRGADRSEAPRGDRGGYRGGDRNDSYRGAGRTNSGYRGSDRTDAPRTDRADGGYRRNDRSDTSRSDQGGSRNNGARRATGARFGASAAHNGGAGRSQQDFGGNRRYDSAPAASAHRENNEDVKLERLTAVAENVDLANLGFGDLGLDSRIVEKLAAQGIDKPFPVQAATIPDAVAGRNVLGRARTGSGKTVAYAAPMLTRLLTLEPSRANGRAARALILAPTRELAVQIDKAVQPLARAVGLFTIAIFGGVPQHKQATGLNRGVDVIIATPGRLEDLVDQGLIDLGAIHIAIVDEADHMCELGFIEPLERILSSVNPRGQRMLFSATLDREVESLVRKFLPDPIVHEADSADDSGHIDHQVLLIEPRAKAEIVNELAAGNPGLTVVFTRTRAYAEMLSDELNEAGIGAAALHGDLNQGQRTRNLAKLTQGRVSVLVATDVAARGIHVDGVTLVIQADAPDEYKTYLHRSGRTGRAGHDGTVVTLIPRSRRRRMGEMLERAEVTAPMRDARPGDELLSTIAG